MRTQIEIDEAIEIFSAKSRTPEVNCILAVLEKDLDYDTIELRYHDEDNPWLEQAGITAREFLDGECDLDDICE